MFKKKFRNSFLIAVMILISISNNITAYGKVLSIDARAAIAMDVKSKRVLYEKNSVSLIPMASTTKIMTSLVALTYGNLDQEITISKKAAAIRGSTVNYMAGEKVTLRELLYGLMLRSGNDAAIAIAEGIAGDVDSFLVLMNEYANLIGATNSHFESPHGLDSNQHYTTTYDLAIITSKAMENRTFREIVGCRSIEKGASGFTRGYSNINKILFLHGDATGVKTGYTGQAGKCLVSSFNYDGNDIVVIVLNCNPRWGETLKIYNHVKDNYEYKKLCSKEDDIAIINTKKSKYKLFLEEDMILPIKRNANFALNVVKPKYVKKDTGYYGRIEVIEEGKMIFNKELLKEKID
ncbi:peptidase S11 D-alanyl-D-alanine carboxypeptidase 1 [Clostridium cellulovorans 743B]|uniref:Peptidase S11 D-alanyl-D-alanine carboxypeptidase 1 n=1 Tax=Clostridium cellulovorans (strain ATCC 35296 / DSM 3052 / OCM 3 / 743B) TaxID=573061 RepID=D9SM60_CLOC7|nr:D-alanyl-D-alanine carboxypeptidase [Clostridium cellulovorans]ADL51791.1 peptidase S11 D-alanyl-D-alanine carboxypeptidase 1 [Clostridium cellulovorans 743B]